MKVNLVAPINQLGYGVVGYNILRELVSMGIGVAYFPIGKESWLDADITELLKTTRENAAKFTDATSVKIWHQFDLAMSPGRGKRVGWPIFELDTFNDRELHHLKSLDHIIVCSEWAKSVIRNNDIDVPTTVVPLGVDPKLFYFDGEEKNKRPVWTMDTTVFINVGKWEKRKGHDELCAAFNAAFTPSDNVELWMINDNPFIGSENNDWRKKFVESQMGSHVKFFPRLEGHNQLRKIFSHVDCGVFPSHAEGWNLEIPELMACGAHIIATNYSGHTEYLTEENSTMIEPNGMEVAQDGKWFHGQGSWCTFDIGDVANAMKAVHEKKQSGKLGINMAGIETASRLSWSDSARTLLEVCDETD